MRVHVTSLTDHRIDILFAKYIKWALKDKVDLVSLEEAEILMITNGIYEAAKPEVLQRMKEIPSIYFIDDHMCWVPDLTAYPNCKILCQFTKHPINAVTTMKYFQVSELALFAARFDNMPTLGGGAARPRQVYWGQYKPERHKQYSVIKPGAIVVGRRYPEILSQEWDVRPFTKSMAQLHATLSMLGGQYIASTPIFGDEYHNGVNLPYRIYEAFMCGIWPEIDEDLLGDQNIDHLAFLYDRLQGYPIDEYLSNLKEARERITKAIYLEVLTIYNGHYAISENLLEVGILESPEDSFMNGNYVHTDSVNDVLKQRGSIYGSYEDGVVCRANMMAALNSKHYSIHGKPLPESVRTVFSDILLKLMRAASDPTHADSWLDLAGYSKLINEMFEESPDVFNR